MREEDELTESQRDTRDALSRMKLPTISLDVSRLRSEAQRRRAIRQVWRWRGIAAALAAGIVLTLVLQPRTTVVERVVYVRQTQSPVTAPPQTYSAPDPQETTPLSADGYFALRSRVLAFGIDVLRPPPRAAGQHGKALPVPTASPILNPASIADGGSL